MNDTQLISDPSDLKKYRTELPNLYDDSDLNVYEYRLLGHYKRVGECTEGLETTAKKCGMSEGKASQTRQSLADKGWITLERVAMDGAEKGRYRYIVYVVDRWIENFAKYSKLPVEKVIAQVKRVYDENGSPSPHEASPSPHEASPSPHEGKKEPFKKEPSKKELRAAAEPKPATPDEVKLFRETTERFPPKINYDDVVASIAKIRGRLGREVTRDDLLPFYKKWCALGYKSINLAWLEWAEIGKIPDGKWNANNPNYKEPKGFDAGRKFLERRGVKENG